MVEKEYPGLTSKKFCNPVHHTKIEFLCTKDGTLCCAACAIDHSDHFEKVEDIKSIFDSKLTNYRKLKSKLKILSQMPNSKDEIRSYIGQLLESSFDQLISRVADMKREWIEEHFQRIMESLKVEFEQKMPDLAEISAEVEETFKKIQNYVNSDELDSSGVMNLRQPEELEPLIEQILESSNKRKKYKDIKITLNFDPDSLKRMINIEGYSQPLVSPYEGSLLDKTDLDYTLSLFPTPVKELKMLFSGRRDGMESSKFHSKCDGHGDTLTVMKGNGHIFGGYAKPQWNSATKYIEDNTKSSFLFTCRSRTKHPLIANPEYAIRGHSNLGPTFGGGCDIYIDNTGRKGYNNTGRYYSIPEGGNKENYLAGTTTNDPNSVAYEDYEVHQVIFQ